jgi:hypothetical protein
MRTNNVLSYPALYYQLEHPEKAHRHNHYAHIFLAHIGSLFREAKQTGTQSEVDALMRAIYGGGSVAGAASGGGDERVGVGERHESQVRDEAFEAGEESREESGEESGQGPKA